MGVVARVHMCTMGGGESNFYHFIAYESIEWPPSAYVVSGIPIFNVVLELNDTLSILVYIRYQSQIPIKI